MYTLYATTENGNGYVSEVGRYKELDEILIRVNIFAKNVTLTIEEEGETK